MERLEILGREEWLVAIRPGGAKWLVDSMDGTVQRLENVGIELPSGAVVYETRAIVAPGHPAKLDLTTPFPVITRNGEEVTVSFERAPTAGDSPSAKR